MEEQMVIEKPEQLGGYEFQPQRRRNTYTTLWDHILSVEEPTVFRLERGKQWAAETDAKGFRSTLRSAARERRVAVQCAFEAA